MKTRIGKFKPATFIPTRLKEKVNKNTEGDNGAADTNPTTLDDSGRYKIRRSTL